MNTRQAVPNTFLPKDPTQAAQRLIKVSQALLDLSERETSALVQNDLVTFAILQDEKEMLAGQYTKASEEFRGRIEDFRKVDRSILSRLESIQKALTQKTHSNSAIVLQMQQRAEKNTQKTLITAQELGQKKPIRFADREQTQQERI